MVYLDKAIGVRGDDSNISRLWVRIIFGYVLFHSQLQNFFLRVRGCASIFSDVLAFYDMFFDVEESGHGEPRALCLVRDRDKPGWV